MCNIKPVEKKNNNYYCWNLVHKQVIMFPLTIFLLMRTVYSLPNVKNSKHIASHSVVSMDTFWRNLERPIESIEKITHNKNQVRDKSENFSEKEIASSDIINNSSSNTVVESVENIGADLSTTADISTSTSASSSSSSFTVTTVSSISMINELAPGTVTLNNLSTLPPLALPTTIISNSSNAPVTSKPSDGKDTTACQCGVKKIGNTGNRNTGKIVGGNLAEDKGIPWMAALIFVGDAKPRQFCGGSLINSQYVLTAGHCVQDMTDVGLDKFRIFLGTNLINGNATRVAISEIKTHPAYNKRTLNSDLALIKLATPITSYTDSITPVCLGQTGAPHIGKSAVVSGWGSLSSSSSTVNALRNVQVQVISNPECTTGYSKVKIRITSQMLCAALPKKDSCKGDSGGPLFAKRNKNSPVYDQLGVVSFGQDCARPEFPGVYTRVGRFIPWIKENTKDATYCTQSFSKS